MDLPGGTSGKEPAYQCRGHKKRVLSLSGNISWKRAWQFTPVFLPGESHGQRSLVGYSPWGHKDLDTTMGSQRVGLSMHTHTHTYKNIYIYICMLTSVSYIAMFIVYRKVETVEKNHSICFPVLYTAHIK